MGGALLQWGTFKGKCCLLGHSVGPGQCLSEMSSLNISTYFSMVGFFLCRVGLKDGQEAGGGDWVGLQNFSEWNL